MSDDRSIRPATSADVDDVRAVARAAWHAAYGAVLDSSRIDETVDSWYDPERLVEDDVHAPDRPFFVAERDGSVVGFAEAAPDDETETLAHLYRIYVDPDYWSRGIGSDLLDRIESTLSDRGFNRLQVSVMAENDVGVSFYESRGFERFASTHSDHLDIEEIEYRKALR